VAEEEIRTAVAAAAVAPFGEAAVAAAIDKGDVVQVATMPVVSDIPTGSAAVVVAVGAAEVML
jgi:hypothetical protein